MLRKLKQLFVPLCLVSTILICGVAQAKTPVVYLSTESKKPSVVYQIQQQPTVPSNTLSLSVLSLVSVGSSFTGDVGSTISAPPPSLPVNDMKMNAAFGVEGSFLHMFHNYWVIGGNLGWSPLTLEIPSTAALNGSARYSGQMTVSQLMGNVTVGRRIFTSQVVRLRALVNLGLLYYRTTSAWITVGSTQVGYLPYNGFGFLYGAQLDAIFGSWANGIHPTLSVAYMRATQINLISLQGSINTSQTFPLLDKPKFTESVLMFSAGATFTL